jgi:hypothetical protein
MMEVLKGARRLFGLAFVGILFKLNMLENYVGTWERLSIEMFGSFEQIHCSGKFLGDLKRLLPKLLVHIFSISITNISTRIGYWLYTRFVCYWDIHVCRP